MTLHIEFEMQLVFISPRTESFRSHFVVLDRKRKQAYDYDDKDFIKRFLLDVKMYITPRTCNAN